MWAVFFIKRTAIILDPSVAGDDRIYNAEAGTWSTIFPYGTISGEVSCNNITGNNATAYPEYNNQITQGYHSGSNCWCRMIYPVRSAWMLNGSYESPTDCLSLCAPACGYNLRNYTNHRVALFTSAGN